MTKGSITFAGERIDALDAAEVVRRGLIQVMEGRHCFAHLTVEENLLTGAYTRRDGRARIADDLDKVYSYFPRLKIRRARHRRLHLRRRAADDRDRPGADVAAEADPARRAVAGPGAAARRGDLRDRRPPQHRERVGFLVAEQNTNIALRYADYGYILENGRVVMDGAAAALRSNEDVKEFYLGLSATGRKSYRDVKHYRRRKRWLA